MLSNRNDQDDQTNARKSGKLLLACLICLCLCGVGYSQWLSYGTQQVAEQMLQAQLETVQTRVEDISRLFDEHQQFILLLSRDNSLTRDSMAFVYRCRSELASFIESVPVDQSPNTTAVAHHRLAQLDAIWGDRSSAISHLIEAIRLAQQTDNLQLMGYALNSLGVVQWELGRTPDAIESFQQSCDCLKQLKSEQEIHSLATRNLGLARYAQGNIDLLTFQSAGAIITSSDNYGAGQLTPASEICIDSQLAYAQQVVRLGRMSEARRVLRAAQNELALLQASCQNTNLESEIVSPRAYEESFQSLQRNLTQLNGLSDGAASAELDIELEWQWLFGLHTEAIRFNPNLQATLYADFENQSGLAIPWSEYDWVQDISRKIIQHTYNSLPLHIVAHDEQDYYEAIRWMESQSIPPDAFRFSFEQLDSPWLRDMGPLVARSKNNQSIWIDSHVVRDGMKQRVENDELPGRLNRNWATNRARCPLSIEGGAIASNGNGITVCSTYLQDINRKFGFSNEQTELQLRQITGATELLFLKPLDGELNKHVDMFLTFTAPDTVVVAEYTDKTDKNAQLLDEHAKTLSKLSLAGQPLKVVRLPMPPDPDGHFLTYTNVIYANGTLLVPSWPAASQELEQVVVNIYQELLPNWRIILVDCTALVGRGGALHCFATNMGTASLKPK